MSMLRAFVAIHIPRPIREAIGQSVAALSRAVGRSSVRWVALENIHLTLKFLGDVSPSSLGLLEQMLGAEASRHPTFQIQAGTLGVFPHLKHPRVIWIGLEAPPALSGLQRGVEAAMERLGYSPEARPFSPHLTVGRVQDQVTPKDLDALRAALEETQIPDLGRMAVEDLHLMKSDLKPGGPVYSTLFTAPLAKPDSVQRGEA